MSGSGTLVLHEARGGYTAGDLYNDMEVTSACACQGVGNEQLSGPGSGAKVFRLFPWPESHGLTEAFKSCWEIRSPAGPIEAALGGTQLVHDILSTGLISQFLWNKRTPPKKQAWGCGPVGRVLAKQAQSPGFHS